MIEMNYSEEFKKGTVRFRIATGMGFADLEKKFKIDRKLLKAWDELYFKDVMKEIEAKREEKKVGKKKPKWHSTGSSAGYWK